MVAAGEGKVRLDEGSTPSDQSTAGSSIDRGQTGQEPSQNRSYAVLGEVTSMLRDLEELVQSYGPAWYTESIATRVRRTLAAAEAAMRVSID